MGNTSRYLLLGGAVLLMAQLALRAERKDFSEYQCIVDRQMFGQPPPGFDPTKPPSEVSAKDGRTKEQELSKEQEQIKSSIRFSMINQTPDGVVKVGFSDNADPKNPKSYYLKVGESCNGWTVKEADALKEEMTIVKGEVEVTLTLGGDSATGAGTTKSTRAGSGAGNALKDAPNRVSRGLGSLSQRRQQREREREANEAAVRAEREEAARQREEERALHEKEREEQRAQMMQIQEELRKAREQREKEEKRNKEENGGNKGDDEGGDE